MKRTGLAIALLSLAGLLSLFISCVPESRLYGDIEFSDAEYLAGEFEVSDEAVPFSVFVRSKSKGRPKVDYVSTSCGCVAASVMGYDPSKNAVEIRLLLRRTTPVARKITVTACATEDKRCCTTHVLFSVKGGLEASITPQFLGIVEADSIHDAELHLSSVDTLLNNIQVSAPIPKDLSRAGVTFDIEKEDTSRFKIAIRTGTQIGFHIVYLRIADEEGEQLHREIPLSWEIREAIWISPRSIAIEKKNWTGSVIIGHRAEKLEVTNVVGTGVQVSQWACDVLKEGYLRMSIELKVTNTDLESPHLQVSFSDGSVRKIAVAAP